MTRDSVIRATGRRSFSSAIGCSLAAGWLPGRRTASMRASARLMAEAVLVAACLLVGSAVHGAAADRQEPVERAAKPESGSQPVPRTELRYVPPDRGAPAVRVSGGTRGDRNDGLQIDVLAPPQTGLTVQEQPTL